MEADSVWQAVVAAAPHLADYLRLGTLLMPGGGGSEITSEAIHTFLSLVSLYSDSVIAARGGKLASHQVALRGGVVVSHWTEGCLEGVRRLELLAEMLAERTVGRRKKFPLLLYIEIIKAVCKLHMCRSGLEVNQRSKRMNLAKADAFKLTWKSEAPERFRWWMASSSLHILRPVLYLCAVIVWGRRSWKPWLFSLAMDILADILARRRRQRASLRRLQAPQEEAATGLNQKEEDGGKAKVEELEEAELEAGQREKETVPKEPVANVVKRGAERVPLVGSLAGVALDMLLSLHRYHFYNAGS